MPVYIQEWIEEKLARIIINSEASGNFISPDYVKKFKLVTQKSGTNIQIEGLNEETIYQGSELRTKKVMLQSGHYALITTFEIVPLGKQYDAILEILWLHKQNPQID